MASIWRGSFVVVHKTGHAVDIGIIMGGSGMCSDPWKMKSYLSREVISVSARDITNRSYSNNHNLVEAEAIYESVTGKKPSYYIGNPPEPAPPDQISF